MSAASDEPVQLELELPLDPVQLARLNSIERGAVYVRLGLDRLQINAADGAAGQAIARKLRDESRGTDQ